MTDTSMGYFIKRVRTARGIALNEVDFDLSVSTLSRIENGLVETTSSRLGPLTQALGITFDDLTLNHVISVEHPDAWVGLADTHWDEATTRRLLKELQAMRQPETVNGFLDIAELVAARLLTIHDGLSAEFTKSELQVLNQYFMQLSEFTRIEGFIFQAIVEHVPSRLSAAWLAKSVAVIMAKWQAVPKIQIQQMASRLNRVGEHAILEREWVTADRVIEQAAQMSALLPENVTLQYNLVTVKKMRAMLAKPSAQTRAEFAKVIKTTRLLFSEATYQYLQDYTIQQGWMTAADFAPAPD
ncbi:helix-turn-helix domain-containing protein [Lacticaseibacillus sharpeae]|nr:helix-turn-helix transcriptional regulator [Lacticaseibacillus sharpeae]